MQVLLLIPTAIVLSTIVTFIILSRGLNLYIKKIEVKAKTIQRISLLLIASDFVRLFSSSESKNLVDGIVQGNGNDEYIFESLNNSFGGAGAEIERLYNETSKAYKPSEELSRIKISALYLRSILLLYGFSVSLTQYIIVTMFYSTKSALFTSAISDMLIATVLFSSFFVYISVYIFYISHRLEIRYSRLQKSRSWINQEAQ
jgi:hypothetical protein